LTSWGIKVYINKDGTGIHLGVGFDGGAIRYFAVPQRTTTGPSLPFLVEMISNPTLWTELDTPEGRERLKSQYGHSNSWNMLDLLKHVKDSIFAGGGTNDQKYMKFFMFLLALKLFGDAQPVLLANKGPTMVGYRFSSSATVDSLQRFQAILASLNSIYTNSDGSKEKRRKLNNYIVVNKTPGGSQEYIKYIQLAAEVAGITDNLNKVLNGKNDILTTIDRIGDEYNLSVSPPTTMELIKYVLFQGYKRKVEKIAAVFPEGSASFIKYLTLPESNGEYRNHATMFSEFLNQYADLQEMKACIKMFTGLNALTFEELESAWSGFIEEKHSVAFGQSKAESKTLQQLIEICEAPIGERLSSSSTRARTHSANAITRIVCDFFDTFLGGDEVFSPNIMATMKTYQAAVIAGLSPPVVFDAALTRTEVFNYFKNNVMPPLLRLRFPPGVMMGGVRPDAGSIEAMYAAIPRFNQIVDDAFGSFNAALPEYPPPPENDELNDLLRKTLELELNSTIRDAFLCAYEHAVKSRYRFFSYGDAMLII
jgi:hypothetical protein